MTEKEIKQIIEKTNDEKLGKQPPEKVQYLMDFGDFTIQYEFSLN